MKKIFPVFGFAMFLCVTSSVVFSQDIITLRTGDEIKAIVSEIDGNTVKYRKFENQNGPVYTVEKPDIFMIKYENGTREVFDMPATETVQTGRMNTVVSTEKGVLTYRKGGFVMESGELLSNDEVRGKYAQNPEALALYNKGLKLIKVGKVLVGISLVTSFGSMIFVKDPSMSFSIASLSVASAGLFGSIGTTVSGRKKIRKSVELYNAEIRK
jgi:hypothetical protein